jgi:hypothetical protein
MTNRLWKLSTPTALIVLVALWTENSATRADEPKPDDETGFVALFNGKDLSGWEGDTKLWSATDKTIVGNSPGIKRNEFLATTKEYGDFELRLEFRLRDGAGNTGIQFRSQRVPDSTAVMGYQADIGEHYWGCLYDEHRRNKVLVQAPESLDAVLKKDGWNRYHIRAQGDRVQLKMNGLTTVDYVEPDQSIARRGIIALQVHSGPAMKIEFRNLRIKSLDASARAK